MVCSEFENTPWEMDESYTPASWCADVDLDVDDMYKLDSGKFWQYQYVLTDQPHHGWWLLESPGTK